MPWVTRNKKLDIIFNPKFTIPFLHKAKKIFVLHGSEWFVIPKHFPWYDQLYFGMWVPFYCRHADAFISVANAVRTTPSSTSERTRTGPLWSTTALIRRSSPSSTITERLQAVRAKYGLPEKYILWVGQIESKEHQAAIAGFRADFQANAAQPGHRRCRALEGWDELREVAELGIEDRPKFVGWVSHGSACNLSHGRSVCLPVAL